MLQHTKWLLEEKEEDGSSYVAIDRERFHKLVTALRTAVANKYKLSKDETYFPNKEKVKRANTFTTPGSLTDAHGNITGEKMPSVSIKDDTPKPKDSMRKYSKKWKNMDLK